MWPDSVNCFGYLLVKWFRPLCRLHVQVNIFIWYMGTFCSSSVSTQVLWPTQPPIQWVLRGVYQVGGIISSWWVKLTSHYQVLRLHMNQAICSLF
jgi:hypothetical protein